ncbi:MAG: UDP-N-acetylmuramate dehydrogenase [Patescibacteria group bacterium]
MEILQNYDLKKLNTFGISVNAKFFVEVHSEEDLKELFVMEEFSARGGSAYGGKNIPKIFLGGGSNVLFTKDFDGMVVLNKLKGIEILNENDRAITIRAMGGEIWHDLVLFAVDRGYWGIENLALIPGTVGATPIQNIGAYGVELKDILVNVEAFEIETGVKRIFSKEECKLGYRDSIFKNELKGKYFISAIVLKLSKIENQNINYKILQDYLIENKIEIKNPKDISDAVTNIRRSKLPDPAVIGNAGSFFKNVFLEKEKFKQLIEKYPDAPYFMEDEVRKVPAGWLIEQAEWKGKRVGNVGVHDKQALVLINYGGASGEEVLDLANKIIESIKEKFGIELTPEVDLI